MCYFNENNVINELMRYTRQQFEQTERTIESNGDIFYSFEFVHNGVSGYISAFYNPDDDTYRLITMDCNFCRPAGEHNYSELKNVMDHIRSLFES